MVTPKKVVPKVAVQKEVKSKLKLFGKEVPSKVDRTKGGYTFYFANGTKEFVSREEYLK